MFQWLTKHWFLQSQLLITGETAKINYSSSLIQLKEIKESFKKLLYSLGTMCIWVLFISSLNTILRKVSRRAQHFLIITKRCSTLHADFKHTLRKNKQLNSEKYHKHTQKRAFSLLMIHNKCCAMYLCFW